MLDLLVTIAAFSAFSAILVALGCVLHILYVDYRVMKSIVERTAKVRDNHTTNQLGQMKRLTDELKAATKQHNEAKQELERERAEWSKMKGLHA